MLGAAGVAAGAVRGRKMGVGAVLQLARQLSGTRHTLTHACIDREQGRLAALPRVVHRQYCWHVYDSQCRGRAGSV